ncbi:serine kinase [Brevibacillus sp. SKDU10]|uniref:phosphotransferase n=1 Tax=Brevibacillus sp. SKDU10 TaxID=1247872 RepID=UPI0007C8BCDD|nr:phosphotransferase [Brevibacillus sp. SKDU10]OAJ75732.1 serine kinase [Brevibacillus sp. SKDU10]
MDANFIKALEKAFSCQILGMKPQRSVFSVRTDRGAWIVKGYAEEEKALWVTHLADVLREQGFYNTVKYVANSYGHKVQPIGDRFYTVMKEINGRDATYTNVGDIKKSVTALARFHLAAEGFPTFPFMSEMEISKSPLLEKWERRLEQFQRISKRIATRGPQNRFELMIQGMAKEINRDGQEVLQVVNQMPINQQMKLAHYYGTLAHRDVASHNFLIKESGSCYLIDLDTVAPDMQIVDLVQIASRMLFLHNYDKRIYHQAIESYHKIKHLSDDEIQIIYHLLRYPDNPLREITGIYNKLPGYRIKSVTHLLQLERKLKRERRRFFKEGHF